jgi:hypothetical protein
MADVAGGDAESIDGSRPERVKSLNVGPFVVVCGDVGKVKVLSACRHPPSHAGGGPLTDWLVVYVRAPITSASNLNRDIYAQQHLARHLDLLQLLESPLRSYRQPSQNQLTFTSAPRHPVFANSFCRTRSNTIT